MYGRLNATGPHGYGVTGNENYRFRHGGASAKNASARVKRRARERPLPLPTPPDIVRRAEEDNAAENPYTYQLALQLQTGLHPGSEFNRRGHTRRIKALARRARLLRLGPGLTRDPPTACSAASWRPVPRTRQHLMTGLAWPTYCA